MEDKTKANAGGAVQDGAEVKAEVIPESEVKVEDVQVEAEVQAGAPEVVEEVKTEEVVTATPAADDFTAPVAATPVAETPASETPVPPAKETMTMPAPGVEQKHPDTIVTMPPKKSKAGLVVALAVILLVLIGCGGLAFWFFNIYNSPENAVYAAVSKFISAENVVTNGEVELVQFSDPDWSDENTQTIMKVKFDSSSRTVPNATNVALEVAERDEQGAVVDEHEIRIDLGTAVMADGVIYVKADHMRETVEKYIEEMMPTRQYDYGDWDDDWDDEDYDVEWTVDDDDWALNCPNNATNCGKDVLNFWETEAGELLEEFLETVDGEWWRISILELVDEFASGAEAAAVKKLYSCALDVAKGSYANVFKKLYDEHRFVKVASADGAKIFGDTRYEITFDADNLAEFVNGAMQSELAEAGVRCMNEYVSERYASGSGSGPYSAPKTYSLDDLKVNLEGKDVEGIIPEGLVITVEVDNLTHSLDKMSVAAKKYYEDWRTEEPTDDLEMTLEGALEFSYTAAEVKAPETYRPITELFGKVEELVETFERPTVIYNDMLDD